MTTIDITANLLWVLLAVGIGIAIYFAIYRLRCFIEERRKMKIQLQRQRDALIADLTSRLMRQQASLNDQAFEARKQMIRVSFAVGRARSAFDERDHHRYQGSAGRHDE